LSQYTRVTDGQTDGRTEFSSLYRVYITCSAVKTRRRIKTKHRFSIRNIFRELKQKDELNSVYSWTPRPRDVSLIASARALLSLIFCSAKLDLRCCP